MCSTLSCRGTTLHTTPQSFAEPGTFGTHDDKRGLCAIALQLLCGISIRTALRNQFDELSDSDKDRANAELCRIKGLPAHTDPTDFYDIEQSAAAERLGLIGIQEVCALPAHSAMEICCSDRWQLHLLACATAGFL